MNSRVATLSLVILYFAVILIVGYIAGKKTKSKSDYMVSGQGLGMWVLSFGVMAAVMSGWSWLGNPGAVYVNGYSAAIRLTSLTPLGVVLAFALVAKPIRIISNRAECYTMPDIIAARWNGNPVIRLLSCVILLIGSATYLISQWSSMGTVMQMVLGISYKSGVLIGALIISAYVVAGGMLASMWTNFVQMIVMFFVAIVLCVKSVSVVGGFTEMNLAVAAIDAGYVMPWNGANTMVYTLSYSVLVVLLAYGGQPGFNTKFLMVKNSKQLRWSPLISVCAMIVGTAIYVVGLVGIIMVDQGTIAAPGSADSILLSVVDVIFSPFMTMLIMVAIMAAVMSTAETHLFTSGTTLVQDLMVGYFHKKIEEKKCLLYIRVPIAVVAVFTVILSLNPPAMISSIGAQAFGALCAGYGPVLYLGLRWKRINSKGAIAGMVVGLLFGGVLPVIDPSNTFLGEWTAAGVGVILSTIVTILVSLMTPPEPAPIFNQTSNEINKGG